MFELLKNILFAVDQAKLGNPVCWATIIKTEGSSYRKMWTQMVIAQNMTFEGALSGGCVEREVVRRCNKLFYNKKTSSSNTMGRQTWDAKERCGSC